jgi:hypothetical protein
LVYPFVHPFIAATDKHHVLERGKLTRYGLRERPALSGEQDDGLPRCVTPRSIANIERIRAVEDGSGFQDHPFATSKRTVVHSAVPIMGKCAQIVRMHRNDACGNRPAQNAVVQGPFEKVGEDRKHIEAHGLAGTGKQPAWIDVGDSAA